MGAILLIILSIIVVLVPLTVMVAMGFWVLFGITFKAAVILTIIIWVIMFIFAKGSS